MTIVFTVLYFGLAIICALGAATRNRNPFLWGVLGLMFPLLSLLALLVMGRARRNRYERLHREPGK